MKTQLTLAAATPLPHIPPVDLHFSTTKLCSSVRYNVHRITNPRLENSITVKVFVKHRSLDKKKCWENLTKRLPGRVGTINDVTANEAGTLIVYYTSDDKAAFSLDCAGDLILVPQPLPKRCKNSELKAVSSGGPEEYLVVKESEITLDGDECDKAGVDYSAFARQPHRCQRPVGTCLHNQPLQFWREDKKAVAAHKQGQYFLSNFVTVTDQVILQNTSCNQVVLKAPYHERYQSHVVVEINADHLDIIGDRSEGQVTEVYIDATADKVIVVKAIITNMGIAADFFGVDFANCTSPLGSSDFNKPSKDEIPPQHRITYTATISSPLKIRTECKLVVYNTDQEVVASRRIVLVRGERCMCVWHCRCVCLKSSNNWLPCDPLTIKEYNRAGFPGQLPVTTGADCTTLFIVFQGLLWLFLFLLLIGLLKALLGLCVPYVGVWGLWYLLPEEAQSLCAYMEISLYHCPVIRDSCGFPVHPRTFRRSVHFLPWYSEFILNVLFFVCVLRTCLCDNLSRRASIMMFPQSHQTCPPPQRMTHCCSPGHYPPKHASPCSKRGYPRLSAGGRGASFESLADEQAARRVVTHLVQSYVVFRNFICPMGPLKSPAGTPYSIRGFFLESDNGVYQFTPPSPLMQFWSTDSNILELPKILDPGPFTTVYHSATQILREGELSLYPRGVVINAP